MIETVERQKIEVLVDGPLVARVVAVANGAGIKAYTIMPTLSGAGAHGAWSDDQLSGAEAKVLFVAVANIEKSDMFVERLTPLLESYGLVLMVSTVKVVRGAKF